VSELLQESRYAFRPGYLFKYPLRLREYPSVDGGAPFVAWSLWIGAVFASQYAHGENFVTQGS